MRVAVGEVQGSALASASTVGVGVGAAASAAGVGVGAGVGEGATRTLMPERRRRPWNAWTSLQGLRAVAGWDVRT